MSYILRPGPIRAPGRGRDELEASIVLVGCGGTGRFLAEALGRLLLGRRAALFLVDPDRGEQANVSRQTFEVGDIGRFKAQVLAERLARRFGREVGYSVLPYDARIHAAAFAEPTRLALVVGAVDNVAARRAIAMTLDERAVRVGRGDPSSQAPIFWLDAGNARNSGQVLRGNAVRMDQLRHAFDPAANVCSALPAPGLQRPDLLVGLPEPVARQPRDCARAVSDGEQARTINQLMAALTAAYVERLLDGTCGWMTTYVDLDDGLLRCVPAEPRAVASVVGLTPGALVVRRRAARVAV